MAEYNGWTNYETWNVALWIDNEQDVYNMVREWAKEAWEEAETPKYPWLTQERGAVYILAERIKELVEDENPLGGDASMYTDLLNGALSEVDWREIATGRIEEVEED